jgi:hypothetical protein
VGNNYIQGLSKETPSLGRLTIEKDLFNFNCVWKRITAVFSHGNEGQHIIPRILLKRCSSLGRFSLKTHSGLLCTSSLSLLLLHDIAKRGSKFSQDLLKLETPNTEIFAM